VKNALEVHSNLCDIPMNLFVGALAEERSADRARELLCFGSFLRYVFPRLESSSVETFLWFVVCFIAQ
jgi:hypothetical protein